jgi:hypothetical protein
VVLIRSSNIYLDGATISTELLTNDGGTFINGEGQGDSATTTGYVLTGREVEFEFCFQILAVGDNLAGTGLWEVLPADTIGSLKITEQFSPVPITIQRLL